MKCVTCGSRLGKPWAVFCDKCIRDEAARQIATGPGTGCAHCGMSTKGPRDYHPWAACVMFKELRDGNRVEANLRAVVEYGIRCAAAGIDLDTAMRDMTKLR